MKEGIIFDGWDGLLEVLVCAPLLYILVVLAVKVSGKRTTGQMNNFDWVVTVAMGAIIGSGIVQQSVSVTEAALAVIVLLLLQFTLTYLSMTSGRFERILKAEPKVLVAHGRILTANCRAERISGDEIFSAMRSAGMTRLDQVAWVILENEGSFSIIPAEEGAKAQEAIVPTNLRGPDPEGSGPGASP